MPKSPDAFRTISEVADWLGIQAHVLRFWESKFSQVKPIKRAGGRRYYRPNDMLLLGGIRQLLHEDGLTIKGVQKILREEGVAHVAALSRPLDELTQSQVDDTVIVEAPMIEAAEPETAVVLNFEAPSAKENETAPELPFEVEPPVEPEVVEAVAEPVEATPEPEVAVDDEPAAEETPEPPVEAMAESRTEPEPEAAEENVEPEETIASAEPDEPVLQDAPESEDQPAVAALPAFLQRPMADAPETTDNIPAEPPVVEEAAVAADTPVDDEPPAPKPRIIEMPQITPHDQIEATPALMTAAIRAKHLTTEQAKEIAPLLDKLAILRDSMAARRRNAGQSGPDA